MIEAFTDGACRGNPGPGGWAAVVRVEGEERELSGFDPNTTNNRMELTAAIEALASLPESVEVLVTSDSRYVIDGITKWVHGWKRKSWRKSDGKPVLNQELWQRLDAEAGSRSVRWAWVEGHTGHPENERCDQLANIEIDRHV
ncbi:MAG: ribonuclease HI [Planctomycetota bacterium]|jgi:ribonuclease HI